MAYDVYTLNGYILDVRNYSEYDKRITLFSQENGLVEAVAISSSKPASKLRSFLIRFAAVSVDVVHGKTGYRITRVSTGEEGFTLYKKEAYFVLAKFSNLILSLTPHGVESLEVYRSLENLTKYLRVNIITEEMSSRIFYKHALLLLQSLGYTNTIDNIDSLSENKLRESYEYIISENGLSRVI